ncbi:MAG: HAMP domain-containing protein [Acidobacteria bacterium]|nr:HAMP domain-containing protein [Acidobacteriota bacterium]
MMRTRRTAAWRLALPVILVFAMGSAGVMGVMYRLLAASVRSRGDRWLEAEVTGVAEILAGGHGSHLRQELDAELEELRHHESFGPEDAEDRQHSLFFLAVIGSDGEELTRVARGNQGPLASLLGKAASLTGRVAWIRMPGWEYPVRVAAAAVPSGERVIAGATPFGDMELLEDVRDLAVGGWLAVLLVGAAVSWLSAGRVLARVDRMAATVKNMSMDDLAARLTPEDRDDEIERLALAFNGLLDRIEAGVHQIRAVADAMAHDVRSPLTTIRAGLELARRSEDREAVDDALEHAMEDVDRLVSLLEAVLDVAEAEAGALRVRQETVDLSTLSGQLVELYRPLMEERGITLGLEAPEPVRVRGDPSLLQRALANLLDNVASHLSPGEGAAVRVFAARDAAVLEVWDSGPGFPGEVVERAFERLVKGPDSPGSGLGLAVVRAVALAHRGRAELDQPAGGGSVVRLVFPLA